MRVSERMMFDSLTRGVSKNQERAFEAQRKASSGMRVSKPSDDPVAAVRGLALDQGKRRLDAMDQSATEVELELLGADSALAQGNNLLTRAKEIAVQGATDSLTAEDRTILANEVDALRNDMLGVANTAVGDVYVFGGYRTSRPPFTASGAFNGDAGTRSVELAPGHVVGANVSAAQAFGTGGTTDVFALLEGLRDDLAANDPNAVRARLDGLEAAGEQLGQARGTLGASLERVDTAESVRGNLGLDLAAARADAVELDATSGYTDLIESQNALRAALAQATRIISGLDQASF